MRNTKVLYLVSAENSGEGFWQIGTCDFQNGFIFEQKHFLECYRKELLGSSSAKEVSEAITTNIHNLIRLCKNDGFHLQDPSMGFSYDLPLNVLEEIFDFWVELYKDPDLWIKSLKLLKYRTKISFSNPVFINGLIGDSGQLAKRIEQLHSFRPNISFHLNEFRKPMWD